MFPLTPLLFTPNVPHLLFSLLFCQTFSSKCFGFQDTIISDVTHLPKAAFRICSSSQLLTSSEPPLPCFRMKASYYSSSRAPRKKLNLQSRGSCRTSFCCGCRLSISSSEEADSVSSGRFAGISTLAHAMVQERLDQMIKERQEERRRERQGMRKHNSVSRHGTKFVVMMAMEKNSYDPRRDFRESVLEMIMINRIREAKDLRCLLNYYTSMNSDEYRGLILEVFHDVCRSLFLGYDSR